MKLQDHFGAPEAGPAGRPAKALILRTAAVLLTAAALCLALLAPGANAAVRATTTASIAASASTVAPGASVGITATLKKGTVAFSGATVSIQRRMNGTTAWAVIKSARTDTAGQVKTTLLGNNYNYDYRAVYGGYTTALPSVSAVSTVRVRQTVSVDSTSATSPVAGNVITLSGKTSVALNGKTASLQILNDMTWQTVGTSTVTSLGTYTVKGKATLTGSRSYRVNVSGGTGVTGAVSVSKTFNVYGWFYLSDLASVASLRFGPRTAMNVAGTSYPRAIGNRDSFWWAKEPFAEYNLSFRCTRFEATVGLSDLSPSDLKVKMTTAVDSIEQDHGILGIGQKKTVSVDTRGAFRLKVQNHYVSGNNSNTEGKGIWGNPRILCLSQP